MVKNKYLTKVNATYSFMKNTLVSFACLLFILQCVSSNASEPIPIIKNPALQGTYTLILEGFDWGPAVKKVVVPLAGTITEAKASDFTVKVQRSLDGVEMTPAEASGTRDVLYAYLSDNEGSRNPNGNHITLVLMVHPNNPLDSPIKYVFKDGRGSNQWINYELAITHAPTETVWNKEADRLYPDLDRFDLNGTHSYNGTTLTYASYAPEVKTNKSPLLIWLHGGGEGGTDVRIPLIANKATNYATLKLQSYFDGAFVLVPQTPTFWMQNEAGTYTRGDKEDIYHSALFDLIKSFVTSQPQIDTDRIYIGGCSNGGYMSLKLILEHPSYFAAGYISALAYQNQYITDEQIQRIKNVPLWFIHSKDDTTTIPNETVVPLYNRLKAAGASNVHFSFYDHVIDLTGIYGGEDYYFPGHWSWIYSHANTADFDFKGEPIQIDGSAVSIMEWLGQQHK